MFRPLNELLVKQRREARLPAAYHGGKLASIVSTKVYFENYGM
jgi:hypothetical protein